MIKTKSGICVLLAAALFVVLGCIQSVYAATYFLYGDVYNADGTSGTAATENSNAGLRAYRIGLPGEVAQEYSSDPVYSNRIDPAYFDVVYYPASFNDDVGDSDWTSLVVVGQVVVTICQTFSGQFGWTQASFVAARKKTITGGFPGSDISNSKSLMPDLQMQEIPAPQVSAKGASDVTLTWTGITYDPDDLIAGYTVYRSTEPGGAGGFGEIGTVGQVNGGTVTYNDSGLSALYTYYYQLAVNFEWGGGGGAPLYYVTDARSSVSAAVYTANSPTPTETPSVAPSNTVSPTETPSATETMTITPSYTSTDTVTSSSTLTRTITLTGTSTATVSFTPTCTVTQTSALAVNLMNEELVIFNSPIKNGRLQMSVFSEGSGIAVFYVYNIAGEMVYKEKLPVSAGANTIDREFKKARGIYILRMIIYTPAKTIEMPIRKFAVVTNNY